MAGKMRKAAVMRDTAGGGFAAQWAYGTEFRLSMNNLNLQQGVRATMTFL